MRSEAEYRSQAEALLRLAAAADNMRTRGDLIDEAARCHALAMKAETESADSPAERPAEAASFTAADEDRSTDRSRRTFPFGWLFRFS